jgi:hypothetical protein
VCVCFVGPVEIVTHDDTHTTSSSRILFLPIQFYLGEASKEEEEEEKNGRVDSMFHKMSADRSCRYDTLQQNPDILFSFARHPIDEKKNTFLFFFFFKKEF